MVRTTHNGKPFAAVIDIFPQLCLSRHDQARVEKEVQLLADLGIRRLYFVACPPGYPAFSNPWLAMMPADNDCQNHALASVKLLASPNAAFCSAAKKHGLEAYAILKPYEGGGASTIPHGARLAWPDGGREPCIGGDRILFDSFLARHPEKRIMRRPIPDYDAAIAQPIRRIELTFCLDEIPSTRRAPALPSAPPDYRCQDYPVELALWSSDDNGAYTALPKTYIVTHRIERRTLHDTAGRPLFSEPKRCRIMEITGLDLPAATRYLAVTLNGDREHLQTLQTTPATMFRIFGPDAPIPITLSVHARNGASPTNRALPPHGRLWGMESRPLRNSMEFRDWGFEFEWYGADIFYGDGWHSDSVYGIARGKILAMKGTACEAYPEVRACWLEQVAALIDAGYDGVDIRLQNHSGMVADFADFGFNPPLIERYRQVHGADPREEFDPLKMMAIRGSFFQEFLRDAAALLHRRGRKLQVHLRHAHERPCLLPDFNELGFWAMPKVWLEDWKGIIDLADAITIKDYFWGRYDPAIAGQIRQYAAAKGKPVWMHNYIAQGDGIQPDYINALAADPTVSGILLYEACHAGTSSNEPNEGLIHMVGDTAAWNEAAIAALDRVSLLRP